MSTLNDEDADAEARVTAAFAVAFFEAKENADAIDPGARAIALKLAHMAAGAIYDAPTSNSVEG